MRTINSIILWLLCCSIAVAQTTYVTLKGRQFYDQSGNPFFPVIMNYNVEMGYEIQQGNRVFKAARGSNYGTQHCILEGHTFADCETSVDADFDALHAMKFNTIRLLLRPNRRNGNLGFEILTHEFNHFCGPANFEYMINIESGTNYNSPDAQAYYQAVANVLDRAEAKNMKVILLCASHANDGFPEMGTSQADADDYAAYLSVLASYVKDKPALMAYDLYNEPAWVVDLHNMTQNKLQVCSFVAQWYDAIKAVDQNHLITIGCGDQGDVMNWDPGVMKVDFMSMHLYPTEYAWENYDATVATERVLNQISWCSQHLQRPWIIGECGFSAAPDACITPPYSDGTAQQQADFLATVLPAARDCGASGFSWWEFMDNHTYCVPPAICSSCGFCDVCPVGNPPSTPEEVHGNYWGLLQYADPVNGVYPASAFKPAAAIAIAFDEGNGTPAPAACVAPTANYDDPFLHNVYNPTHTGSISGTVVDQNGNPIEGAVVVGWTFITDNGTPPPNLDDDITDVHYTFSNNIGGFEIIPYDYDQFLQTTNSILAMRISAAGKSRYFYNWGQSGVTINYTLPGNGVYTITDNNFDYDEVLTNLNLTSGSNTIKRGWNTLTINGNVLNGATADFTARNEVQVNTEFNAQQGSETHIYCSPYVFNDCSDDFSNYNRIGNHNAINFESDEKQIEVEFEKKINDFNIYPNPNNGIFILEIKSEEMLPCTLLITNPMGTAQGIININSTKMQIDLSNFAKGIYFLRCKNSTKKLIVN